MKDFDRFLTGLKALVDGLDGFDYTNHGPMRVRGSKFRDSKGQWRSRLTIEAGWDHNYGGRITIEASPTGKSLTVFTSPEVLVRTDQPS